jgi:hypothetical protein
MALGSTLGERQVRGGTSPAGIAYRVAFSVEKTRPPLMSAVRFAVRIEHGMMRALKTTRTGA